MAKTKSKTKITAGSAEFISLVPGGANHKDYLLIKSALENTLENELTPMSVVKAVLDVECDAEKDLEKSFPGTDEKQGAALRGALRILTGYQDVLPANTIQKLASLVGGSVGEGFKDLESSASKLEVLTKALGSPVIAAALAQDFRKEMDPADQVYMSTSLSMHGKAALMAMKNMMAAFEKELPENVNKALRSALEEMRKVSNEEFLKGDGTPNYDAMPKEQRAFAKMMFEQAISAKDRADKIEKENAGLAARLEKQAEAKRRDELIAKAKSELSTQGKPEEIADEFLTLEKANPEAAQKLWDRMARADKLAKQSKVFETFGKDREADADDGSAVSIIAKAASATSELMKSNPKLTEADAKKLYFSRNPKAYAEYRKAVSVKIGAQ